MEEDETLSIGTEGMKNNFVKNTLAAFVSLEMERERERGGVNNFGL